MKAKYFFIALLLLIFSSPAIQASELTIIITEDDDGLIDYTDALGWNESMGLTRKEFAKDQLLGGIVKTVANHRALKRKNIEMQKIEQEELQKAAMELAPKVTVVSD